MKSVLRSYLQKCGDGEKCELNRIEQRNKYFSFASNKNIFLLIVYFLLISLKLTFKFSFLGRNLEKFLRRNSYSSDERDTSTPITTKCRNKTKSLESLSDVKDRTTRVSPKVPAKEKDKKVVEEAKEKEEKPKSMETKVVVKQSGEKTDKKKSQFNYESIIEITLPSNQALPALNPPVEIPSLVEEKEEPITPVICSSAKPKIPPQNPNMSPISTHESLVSNKQNPMEWDSFMPVSC